MAALEKITKVNALTSALQNNEFLQIVKKMPEGDFILEIFAAAIEKELERMFDTNASANCSFTTLETRIQAINESRLVGVLEALLGNLNTTRPAEPQQQPPPINYFPEPNTARISNPLSTF